MLVILGLFTFVYCSLIGALLYHWAKIKACSATLPVNPPLITIIIVVRNEAANIVALLKDIAAQDYPENRYEVIVVDDHSTDQTYGLVEAYKAMVPYHLHVLVREETGDSMAYKKAAIAQGIKHAVGELILTTDGDCRVGKTWLKSFAACYQQSGARLISGLVTFDGEEGLFQQMQTIEFASLIGLGAAAMQAGMPMMCNGANLCYQKAAFLQVGGYSNTEHIPSGDDEHLLHKISKQFPGQIVFNNSKEAVVYTLPKASFREFEQQRIRWAGKWKHSTDAISRLTAVYLFAYHLLLLGCVLAAIGGGLPAWVVSAALTVKFILEAVFLKKVMQQLDKPLHPFVLLLLQLVYPLYVVYFGLLIHIKKSYTWKGRKVSS